MRWLSLLFAKGGIPSKPFFFAFRRHTLEGIFSHGKYYHLNILWAFSGIRKTNNPLVVSYCVFTTSFRPLRKSSACAIYRLLPQAWHCAQRFWKDKVGIATSPTTSDGRAKNIHLGHTPSTTMEATEACNLFWHRLEWNMPITVQISTADLRLSSTFPS